jgi:hypothetical protein
MPRVSGRFGLAVLLLLFPLLALLLPAGVRRVVTAVAAEGAQLRTWVLRVPLDFPTSQEAIDAAAGDEVRVLMTDIGTEPEYFGEYLAILNRT